MVGPRVSVSVYGVRALVRIMARVTIMVSGLMQDVYLNLG